VILNDRADTENRPFGIAARAGHKFSMAEGSSGLMVR
jgi:hypothetical protein